MTLIADSGSTKTDWALVDGDAVRRIQTQGLNPFHQDIHDIIQTLERELLPQLGESRPSIIRFFGAGCNEVGAARMEVALSKVFPEAHAEVASDLLGAAHALCGREAGMAAILGTGSNSCLYDGERIVANVPPMGYILGDEGSGAVLGRRFVGALYKGLLGHGVRETFEQAMGLDYAGVLDRVYRQPMAGRFLASIVPFIRERSETDERVRELVLDNFGDFIDRNIMAYRSSLPLHAVGSVAYYFERELRKAAAVRGVVVGRILKAPVDGLVAEAVR